jgi:hypothetical protein
VGLSFVVLVVAGTVPSSGRAAPQVTPALFNEVASGVALIKTYRCNNQPVAQGTGFLVGDSVVMTARHVLLGACKARIYVDKDVFSAKRWVYWYGSGSSVSAADIATIKLDHSAASGFVFRVRSSLPPIGANLGMVGYPLGNRLSLNQGKLIARGRVSGAPLMEVQMLGAEGASGAPFIDDEGRVVGILQIGLGSKDIFGQRTSGVLLGLDLVRWWGPRARLDLCHAYPNGGIAGCPNTSKPSPPPPPATTPVSVTGAYMSATNNGNDPPQSSFPSVASFTAYFQMTFAAPVKGLHIASISSVGPDGVPNTQCNGVLTEGWQGAECDISLGDYPTPGSWRVVYAIDGKQQGTVQFQITGATSPSGQPHIQQCWAQYTGGSNFGWNPADSTTVFSASDILARGSTNFTEIASLDRVPSSALTGVTLALIEPNGQIFYTATVPSWSAGYGDWGFDFHWTWGDGTLFFQHPEISGTGNWTFKWTGPDGQTCVNTITVS